MLSPVAGDVATVAPDITQVFRVTAQLSAVVGLAVARLLEHVPAVTVLVTFAGQVIVGLVVSVTVTVNEHVTEFPAASCAV